MTKKLVSFRFDEYLLNRLKSHSSLLSISRTELVEKALQAYIEGNIEYSFIERLSISEDVEKDSASEEDLVDEIKTEILTPDNRTPFLKEAQQRNDEKLEELQSEVFQTLLNTKRINK